MGRTPDAETRDGIGCLWKSLLGAILTSGVLLILVLTGVLGNEVAEERWPWLLVWIGCPLSGIALLILAVRGFGGSDGPRRPGMKGRLR